VVTYDDAYKLFGEVFTALENAGVVDMAHREMFVVNFASPGRETRPTWVLMGGIFRIEKTRFILEYEDSEMEAAANKALAPLWQEYAKLTLWD
jgi:hypothetical protein